MQLNVLEIKEILPHRYPFLLIDKIIDMDIKRGTIVAQKNVTTNEEFFNGHFPNQPIMPGVLIVEAMAQAVGVLGIKMRAANNEEFDNKRRFILAGIDNVRIKHPVVPGDILKIYAKMGKIKKGVYKSQTESYIEKNKIVASANFVAAYRKV